MSQHEYRTAVLSFERQFAEGAADQQHLDPRPVPPLPEPKPVHPTVSGPRCAPIVASLIAGVALLASIVIGSQPFDWSSMSRTPSDPNAVTTCHEVVKGLLEDPAGAVFSNESSYTTWSMVTIDGTVTTRDDDALKGHGFSCNYYDAAANAQIMPSRAAE